MSPEAILATLRRLAPEHELLVADDGVDGPVVRCEACGHVEILD
jgi:uncharacterized Zn finger protein